MTHVPHTNPQSRQDSLDTSEREAIEPPRLIERHLTAARSEPDNSYAAVCARAYLPFAANAETQP